MKLHTYLAIFYSLFVNIDSKESRIYSKQRVVLISFDGFRHDYIDRHDLKNFKSFARYGVKADSLKPVFVTKTFPNHFTIATGLYEESHGIIANRMYDPVYKEHFNPSSTDPKWWNSTKPIWMLNEERVFPDTNKTGKSATIFWPGSETSYGGKFPFFTYKKYNATFSIKDRFDKIVELLMGHSDVNFVACYMNQPDGMAHKHGPDSLETIKMLKDLDKQFGYFQRKMDRAQLLENVTIIV